MRIPEGYTTKRVLAPGRVKSRGAAAAVQATAGVNAAATDTVEFSARAGEVAHARNLALHAPDVREPLVAEVSSLIGQGQYEVTGAQVAPVMIREHLLDAGIAQASY